MPVILLLSTKLLLILHLFKSELNSFKTESEFGELVMYILLRNSLLCIIEVLMLPLLSIRKDKKAMVSILDISLFSTC